MAADRRCLCCCGLSDKCSSRVALDDKSVEHDEDNAEIHTHNIHQQNCFIALCRNGTGSRSRCGVNLIFKMVEPINFSIKEKDNQLNYDISSSELKSCADGDFRFYLSPADNNMQKGVFQVILNGQLVREHESELFPEGTFQIKSSKRANKVVFKVVLVKSGNARIGEYFM